MTNPYRYKESVSRQPKRVTLEEVARIAGVSRATVSRVVNGVTSVDESIRQTVERAIATTGYLPNLAARALVTRRADAIALVLPSENRIHGDPFFTRIVHTGSRGSGSGRVGSMISVGEFTSAIGHHSNE